MSSMPELIQCVLVAGHNSKTALSPKMKQQAAAVAAELSARSPDEGVAKTAPLVQPEAPKESTGLVNDSAVHPKLRQKTAGSSR